MLGQTNEDILAIALFAKKISKAEHKTKQESTAYQLPLTMSNVHDQDV